MGIRINKFDDLWSMISGVNINYEEMAVIRMHLWDLEHSADGGEAFSHSVRVAKLASGCARDFGVEEGEATITGLLHDVGKMYVSSRVLSKTGKFNERDMSEMQKHVGYSYEILKNQFPFYADVAVRHHVGQGIRSYPGLVDLPAISIPGSEERVERCTELIAKCDYDDARANRNDGWLERIDAGDVRTYLPRERDKRVLASEGVGLFVE